MQTQIIHQEDQKRFNMVSTHEEHYIGNLDYRKINEHLLDYHYTYIDPKNRGHGYGKTLVKAALSYAQKKGYKIRPSCPMVANIMNTDAEYEGLKE